MRNGIAEGEESSTRDRASRQRIAEEDVTERTGRRVFASQVTSPQLHRPGIAAQTHTGVDVG